MKPVIILISLLASLQAQLIDLGKIGPTKEIIEEDLIVLTKKKLSELKIEDLKKKLIASVDARATVNSSLGYCVKSNENIYQNLAVLEADHYDFGGNLLFKKGDTALRNFPIKSSICVVDGANLTLAKSNLDQLLKIGRCDKVLVANADFRKLQREYKQSGYQATMKFYPYHEKLTQVMKIKCLPSRSEAYKEHITVNSIQAQGVK